MRSLSHPHIIRYIDSERIEDNIYILMELGYHSLYDELTLIHKKGLAGRRLRWMVKDFGYKFIYEMGWVHLDIKASNIMLGYSEGMGFSYKICDFGLSEKIDPATGDFKGARGSYETCHPAILKAMLRRSTGVARVLHFPATVDLWSIGCLIHHAATGELPFTAELDLTVARMQRDKKYNDVSAKELNSGKVGEIIYSKNMVGVAEASFLQRIIPLVRYLLQVNIYCCSVSKVV